MPLGISMSPKARYVTQSSVYSSQLRGPLTDRKIEQYRKAGYYSNGVKSPTEEVRKKKRKRSSKVTFEKLFGQFL